MNAIATEVGEGGGGGAVMLGGRGGAMARVVAPVDGRGWLMAVECSGLCFMVAMVFGLGFKSAVEVHFWVGLCEVEVVVLFPRRVDEARLTATREQPPYAHVATTV